MLNCAAVYTILIEFGKHQQVVFEFLSKICLWIPVTPSPSFFVAISFWNGTNNNRTWSYKSQSFTLYIIHTQGLSNRKHPLKTVFIFKNPRNNQKKCLDRYFPRLLRVSLNPKQRVIYTNSLLIFSIEKYFVFCDWRN